MKKEIIGGCVLYLGDCLEIIPTLGKFDALVTDPPYGINYDPSVHKNYDGSENNFSSIKNDEKEMDFSYIFSIECPKVIWGAENFYSQLPHRGRWCCWHKRSNATKPNSMPSGDFELAWMDKKSGFYKFHQCVHGGAINADSIFGNNEKRVHPTQKPVSLMKFSIEQCVEAQTILDPFMGSGTTGVACVKLGRKFIGIELDEKYFEIACKRIEEAYKQPDMFIEAPVKAKQDAFI